MHKWLTVIIIIGFFYHGRGQEHDTLKAIEVRSTLNDSIIKMASTSASIPYYRLNEFVLQRMGVVDIGEALKQVPGANIKDYGGIGGLKTINYRSLGNAHTGIEQDGISIPDQQTGAVNLGNYNVFGISTVEMSTGQVQHQEAFATSFLKANMISVFNTISSPGLERTIVRGQSEWLSINALQNSFLAKQSIGKRLNAGVQGIYRTGTGIYNYQLANGQNIISGERAPTDLTQKQVSSSLRYDHKRLKIVGMAQFNDMDQNLPGAVVFYNPFNKETLTQKNQQYAIKGTFRADRQSLSGHAFSRESSTRYFQDYVLNHQGFIENTYQQNHIGGGFIYHYYLGSANQSIFIGADMIQSQLEGSQYEIMPLRESVNSVLGLTKWFTERLKIQANLAHQHIKDRNLEAINQFSHISPYLSFAYRPFLNHALRIRTFYKNTFRMPSFNDLYYRSIGNIDLQPENAHLFNLGITYHRDFDDISLESTIDAYHNAVSNKIVAIPTKNLFNWSMQNIGRTQGQGIDLNLLVTKNFEQSALVLSTSQSINKSIDVTDKGGFTYGHQLPYTPNYFASYQANFRYMQFISSLNLLHSAGRYVLTENVAHNYLGGFVDIGFNMAYAFKFRKGQDLTIKAQVNNILNRNYQVVRSFPMPGRHYQFTVLYQLKK